MDQYEACPFCGVDVLSGKAGEIRRDMEADNRSCVGCSCTFGERRREMARADGQQPREGT